MPSDTLAQAEEHLQLLIRSLRAVGLSIPPQKALDFLLGLTLTPLSDVDDIYWVGRITLVSNAEDVDRYDEVFRLWCSATITLIDGSAIVDDESEAITLMAGFRDDSPELTFDDGTGKEASGHELLGRRLFGRTAPSVREQCSAISDAARSAVPQTRIRRLRRSHRGQQLDLRRTLATALGSNGEIVELWFQTAPKRPRRMLILIDVSGSQKANSADYIRFAHAVVRGTPRCEVFTFGTRLTRVTSSLREEDVDDSLEALVDLVLDFDGGTRIGDALDTLLSSSRWRTLASGAEVVVLSDGLETGSPDLIASTVERLSRVAHRLIWLSPLASSDDFVPATRAMVAIEPYLDRIGSSGSLTELHAELLNVAQLEHRPRRRAGAQTSYRLPPLRATSR
ncbi:MAG: vWA domain-containing protein [Acidimicrobiia bacterium]